MVARRNPVAVEFLRTEAETASVLAKIASDARDEEKKRRNIRNARVAYQTLLHFANQLVLTADERDEMRKKLVELRRQLVDLGEIL